VPSFDERSERRLASPASVLFRRGDAIAALACHMVTALYDLREQTRLPGWLLQPDRKAEAVIAAPEWWVDRAAGGASGRAYPEGNGEGG